MRNPNLTGRVHLYWSCSRLRTFFFFRLLHNCLEAQATWEAREHALVGRYDGIVRKLQGEIARQNLAVAKLQHALASATAHNNNANNNANNNNNNANNNSNGSASNNNANSNGNGSASSSSGGGNGGDGGGGGAGLGAVARIDAGDLLARLARVIGCAPELRLSLTPGAGAGAAPSR